MEVIGSLLFIGFVLLVIVLPIYAALTASESRRQVDDMRQRLREVTERLQVLQDRLNRALADSSFLKNSAAEAPPKAVLADSISVPITNAPPIQEAPAFELRPLESNPIPPPLPVNVAASGVAPVYKKEVISEPLVKPVVLVSAPKVTTPAKPALTLEQFLGVKLFAWLGGLALFFGIAFFVKYSFDHDLIPPIARIFIGFVIGMGLVATGIIVHRKEAYAVLAQTFCASGVLILYGVTFAGNSLYDLYGQLPAFGIMTLTTALAFFLAVRMNALVIAILGMVGGFLTPFLCSTGQDNPLGLFGYIALLDIGLLAVAKHRRWLFLSAFGAGGTALMQLAWFGKFFDSQQYYADAKTLIPIGIFTGFLLLFLIASWWSKKRDEDDLFPAMSTVGLCGVAMLFAFSFLGYHEISNRAELLYGFVFAINTVVLAAIVAQPKLNVMQLLAGLGTFLHLAIWTSSRLQENMLNSALVAYLIFGALHSIFAVAWLKLRPEPAAQLGAKFSPWFPPLTLILMLVPLIALPHVPMALWIAVLMVDLMGIALALATQAVLTVLVSLVITLLGAVLWFLKMPANLDSLAPFLIVCGGFAAVFAIAGCWLAKRFSAGSNINQQIAASLPAFSATLPFGLLILATLRLPITDPTSIFGLALLLTLLLLGLTKIARLPMLSVVSLSCVLALEFIWQDHRFTPTQPWKALSWYLSFYALFAAYPFVFRKVFRETVAPWAAAGFAAIGHFMLIYQVVKISFPEMADKMGLLPAAFALPLMASLWATLKFVRPDSTEARNSQLAWFGGVSLLFITLIFPIQLDRQWLTLAWAFEGAALIWLFRRVLHQGLRSIGLGLLITAFIRLTLNPEVFGYYPRSGAPIFNWHLYTYSLVALSQFMAANWLKSSNEARENNRLRAVLCSLGGVLLFWLLNIEIADYFTPVGASAIAFHLGAGFAQDMTYSISWALFALATLGLGFALKAKGARYAGIGLMAVTLLKLFLHDLASIGSIYRVASLLVVAVIALTASFLYQRFFDKTNES